LKVAFVYGAFNSFFQKSPLVVLLLKKTPSGADEALVS
jgi:hypothetical protein